MHWISIIWSLIRRNLRWMGWNLFLAIIPFLLSHWLFRDKPPQHQRSPLWWLVLFVYIAFLPNAPYVLTDVIHLIYDIRTIGSIWEITLVLLPIYLLFMFVGFSAYALSLMNLAVYLKQQGWGHWVRWVELTIHGLCAIGIYLGRFVRLNSWDLVTQFDAVAESVIHDLLGKRPLLVVVITAIILTALYMTLKPAYLAWGRGYFRDRSNQPHSTSDNPQIANDGLELDNF